MATARKPTLQEQYDEFKMKCEEQIIRDEWRKKRPIPSFEEWKESYLEREDFYTRFYERFPHMKEKHEKQREMRRDYFEKMRELEALSESQTC